MDNIERDINDIEDFEDLEQYFGLNVKDDEDELDEDGNVRELEF